MAVSYKDYYKLLEVERSASAEEISKAFKKLARKHHPDLNPGDTAAEEKFKELNEAYEVLKDPEKRRMYDQLGPDWQHGQQFRGAPGFEGFNFGGFGGAGGYARSGDFSDFFESLFGQGGRSAYGHGGANFGADPFGGFSQRPIKGKNMQAEMTVSLEDALHGARRTITLSSGQGKRDLEVNIPAGIKEGAKLRLSGQGEPSPTGGASGDLLLSIRFMAHPHFSVQGNDLSYDALVMPWEAVLGTKITVPTLDGEIEMNIPAGTSSGKRFRLRGKGLGKESARGDLTARIMIKSPEKISEEESALWLKLAELHGANAVVLENH